MIREYITAEDIKNIFSGANGQADLELKKLYLKLRIEQIGINNFFDKLSQDDITTMVFKTRKEEMAEEILKRIVGDGKKITTKKSIEIVFSDVNGNMDYDMQKRYLIEFYPTINIEFFLGAVSRERINEFIIITWNYEDSKKILREMFKQTEKYISNKSKKQRIDTAIEEWKQMDLGEIKWPFAARQFDDIAHQLNRQEDISEADKDEKLCKDVIRYRRIKDISALKNDYIEYLVFENNENIIPTFGNKGGVDFYIDGEPYDQKVSRSVGADFIKQYGDEYRKIAIENPKLLARSLYEHQDANRFGADPRFFVVFLDMDISTDELEEKLEVIDFSNPMMIEFDFKGIDKSEKTYSTSCFLFLLHR